MKIRSRLILILLCFMVLALSACNADGMSYLTMQEKLLDLSSYHQSGSLHLQLDAEVPEDWEESTFLYLPSVINALNDVKMDYDVRYCEGQSTNLFCVSTKNTTFAFHSYLTENGNIICDIPTVAKAFLPQQYMNAEYVEMDTSSWLSGWTDKAQAKTAGSIPQGAAKQLMSSVYTFLKNYLPKTSLPDVVQKNGNLYTVHVSDENLKAILKSLADTYLTDETARGDVKILYSAAIEFYSKVFGEEIAEAVGSGLDEFFNMDIKEAKAEADDFFAKLDTISLLGSEGIVINVSMGKKGYPDTTESTIDLRLDMVKLRELFTDCASDETPFILSGQLYSQTKLSEINEIAEIDIPKVDGKKTILFSEWSKARDEQQANLYGTFENEDPDYIDNVTLPAADGSVTVFVHSYRQHFAESKPKLINGALYIPISALGSNWLKYGVYDDMVCLYQWGKCYYTSVGSSVFQSDSEAYTSYIDVKQPVLQTDGEVYIPLRAVWEGVLSRDVHWDAERNSVFLW